ncbi:MAG: hypothetical protein ACRDRX_16595 [Pseudonocardiaceae bacterium]
MAASAVRTFGADRREGILAEIISALLRIKADDRDALRMTDSVVSAVATLRSGVARANLIPLATALEARPRRTGPTGTSDRHHPSMSRVIASHRHTRSTNGVDDVGEVVTLHEDPANADGYVWGYICRSTCDDVVRLRGVMNGQLSRDSNCRATAL